MEMRDILHGIIDLAHSIHQSYKQHHQLDIAIAQESDNLGLGLRVVIGAAIPAGALLFGRIDGFWLGSLLAVDEVLFRDQKDYFLTIGPINDHHGTLYIPYGAVQVRSPGLHTLSLSIHLLDPQTSNTTEIGQASCKIALAGQHPWNRIEFFLPLIRLCMAMIRVDNEVLPAEIRGLREYLTSGLALRPEDMPHLRLAMKDTNHDDPRALIESLKLRMPMLTPEGIFEILCIVARLDGPINVHEHALLRHIADILSISPAHYTALAAGSRPAKALGR